MNGADLSFNPPNDKADPVVGFQTPAISPVVWTHPLGATIGFASWRTGRLTIKTAPNQDAEINGTA